MNEELQKALEQFLVKVIQGIETAEEFAVEQVPDVIQQALTWFAVKSSLGFLLGVLIIASVVFGFKYLMRYWEEVDELVVVAFSVIGPFLTLLGAAIVAENLEWLQILIAPKWFIVSEMSKLL